MTGALTGLSDDDLGRWLREVRKVAALSDSAALTATDTLIWAVVEWHSRRAESRDSVPSDAQGAPEALDDRAYALWMITEDLGRLRESCARLRGAVGMPGALSLWEPDSLRRQAANVGHLAGPDARREAGRDIADAQAAANALADELDVRVHEGLIHEAAVAPIHNAASVSRILASVDRSVAFLRGRDALSPEAAGMARNAKQRAARYRSERRLEEAEVAAAGGNVKKAERLRREAGIMLQQDRAKAGLGPEAPESDPPLDS